MSTPRIYAVRDEAAPCAVRPSPLGWHGQAPGHGKMAWQRMALPRAHSWVAGGSKAGGSGAGVSGASSHAHVLSASLLDEVESPLLFRGAFEQLEQRRRRAEEVRRPFRDA